MIKTAETAGAEKKNAERASWETDSRSATQYISRLYGIKKFVTDFTTESS